MKLIQWFKHQIELWKIEEEERVLLSNNYMTKEADRNPAKFMKDYMDIQHRRKKARQDYRAKGQ